MSGAAPSYGKPGTVDHGFSKISLTVNGAHTPSEDGKSFIAISADALTAACGVGCIDHANIDSVCVKNATTDMGANVDFVATLKGGNGADIAETTVTPRCHVLDGNKMRTGHFSFSPKMTTIDQVIPLNTADNRRDENLAAAYRGAVMAGDVRAMRNGNSAALNKGILCVENHISSTGITERKYLVPTDTAGDGPIARTFNQNRLDPELVFFDDKYHPENATIVDAASDGSSEGLTKKYIVVDEEDHTSHKDAVHDLLTPKGVLAKMDGLGIATLASDPTASGNITYNLEINRTPITASDLMQSELEPTGVFDGIDEDVHPRVDMVSLKQAFSVGEELEQPATESTLDSLFNAGAGTISVLAAGAQ